MYLLEGPKEQLSEYRRFGRFETKRGRAVLATEKALDEKHLERGTIKHCFQNYSQNRARLWLEDAKHRLAELRLEHGRSGPWSAEQQEEALAAWSEVHNQLGELRGAHKELIAEYKQKRAELEQLITQFTDKLRICSERVVITHGTKSVEIEGQIYETAVAKDHEHVFLIPRRRGIRKHIEDLGDA